MSSRFPRKVAGLGVWIIRRRLITSWTFQIGGGRGWSRPGEFVCITSKACATFVYSYPLVRWYMWCLCMYQNINISNPILRFELHYICRRRALHKFDPPDLKDADVHKPQDPLVAAMASTFAATAVMGQGGEKGGDSTGQSADGSVQAKQIADAASNGLLVDFGGSAAGAVATGVATAAQGLQDQEEERYQEMIQQAEEEGTDDLVAFIGKSTGDDILDDVDSDDDLL